VFERDRSVFAALEVALRALEPTLVAIEAALSAVGRLSLP